MRFKASIKNVSVFSKITASLNLLATYAWIRLDNDHIRFTVLPDSGTQVWAVIAIDSIFDDDFTIQSAAENNTINLEVPLATLHRALRTAHNATTASIRLTKKDKTPYLALTIAVPTPLTTSGRQTRNLDIHSTEHGYSGSLPPAHGLADDPIAAMSFSSTGPRETTITQDVAIKVMPASAVEGMHEPRGPEPEVHILLPPLLQLKAISERFTKLGLSTTTRKQNAGGAGLQGTNTGPKLEISANMHGELKLGIKTEALKIESRWTGLHNPALDPEHVEGGEEGIRQHPSTRMREATGEESFVTARVSAKDWSRVLGVGRIGGKVVACFSEGRALILYVYLPNVEPGVEESVLTYYITSYST